MSTCLKCGNELMEGVRFCNKCGFEVGAYLQPAQAPTPVQQIPVQQQTPVQQAPESQFAPQQPVSVQQPQQPYQAPASASVPTPTLVTPAPASVSVPGPKAKKEKKVSVLSIILAIVCTILVIGIALGAVLFLSYKKSMDLQVSEIKEQLKQSESTCEDLNNKLADKESAYKEKVASYDALNKDFKDLKADRDTLYDVLKNLKCYNYAISFDSNVYAVKVGQKLRIKGEWAYNVYDPVYLGTSTPDLIDVQWDNSTTEPYVAATGLEPGIAVVKFGSDEYLNMDTMGFIVIVYE